MVPHSSQRNNLPSNEWLTHLNAMLNRILYRKNKTHRSCYCFIVCHRTMLLNNTILLSTKEFKNWLYFPLQQKKKHIIRIWKLNFLYENSRTSAQYCHLHIGMKISMNSNNLSLFPFLNWILWLLPSQDEDNF